MSWRWHNAGKAACLPGYCLLDPPQSDCPASALTLLYCPTVQPTARPTTARPFGSEGALYTDPEQGSWRQEPPSPKGYKNISFVKIWDHKGLHFCLQNKFLWECHISISLITVFLKTPTVGKEEMFPGSKQWGLGILARRRWGPIYMVQVCTTQPQNWLVQ